MTKTSKQPFNKSVQHDNTTVVNSDILFLTSAAC